MFEELKVDEPTVGLFKEYLEGLDDVAPTGAMFRCALELWDDVVLYERVVHNKRNLEPGTLAYLVARVN